MAGICGRCHSSTAPAGTHRPAATSDELSVAFHSFLEQFKILEGAAESDQLGPAPFDRQSRSVLVCLIRDDKWGHWKRLPELIGTFAPQMTDFSANRMCDRTFSVGIGTQDPRHPIRVVHNFDMRAAVAKPRGHTEHSFLPMALGSPLRSRSAPTFLVRPRAARFVDRFP
jgi:hypothetical protein